jgi:hypothetical protein
MNKHLKPGVAVDVRGASKEVKEQVMAAFVAAGAKRDGCHGQSCPGLQNFAYWDEENDVWFSPSVYGPIITINQALGWESEVESTWFERGEFPPVDTQCMKGDCVVKIVCYLFNGDSKYAAYQHIDGFGCGYTVVGSFKPLKTEKDRAIEEMLTHMDSAWHKGLAAQLYDAGYRKTE